MLQEKRKKAQAISAQNKNPHLFSRGGYRKLEEKILKEKEKPRPLSFEDDSLAPHSPSSRHRKWKLVRLRSSGTCTSKTTREISKKIVRVNFTLNNNIILESHHHILATSIGRLEHPGCVHVVGSRVDIR